MGQPSTAAPVKPIVALLAASTAHLEEVCHALTVALTAVELASEPGEWTVSRYYEREMGSPIWRQYVALADLMPPEELIDLKLRTNEMEKGWRVAGERRVNLDPGYVDLSKLVLASTKDAAHRVYLGRGIYAESTLHFVDGEFRPWPYTYPDYAAPEAIRFFTQVRARCRTQRRALASTRTAG